MLDIDKIRKDFPILSREVYGKPLVYFDNAASSQKPTQVIEAISHYYENEHSNIHRGVHHLSAEATEKYEEARKTVQRFINAEQLAEIIFTKGTTDSINLVAYSFGSRFLNEGDEVLVSTLEHHSNIVPWQMICEARGAKLKVIPINDAGELLMDQFESLLSKKTKIVAVNHVSNSLGTINPVKEIINAAHKMNIPVLLDGAQAMPHLKVDVQDLDCDFYTFSSHKMFGPTGVGVLYGKEKLLNEMPPYQGGGDMIDKVTFEKTTYNDLPHKFEAGTPNIAGGIGLKAAIDYMNELGVENIASVENELLEYATQQISQIEGVRLIGTAKEKASVLSFLIGDIHPYDIGTILDRLGIAVRTGHHCTEPLMDRFNIPGTVRASFSFYNTKAEVDVFISALKKAIQMLS
ncbi:MAG: cysteine desulfurase, partial [Flavobacteriales bacterium]|nr:cysteine desulfurase [Flavobacteriales bacterium]